MLVKITQEIIEEAWNANRHPFTIALSKIVNTKYKIRIYHYKIELINGDEILQLFLDTTAQRFGIMLNVMNGEYVFPFDLDVHIPAKYLGDQHDKDQCD